MKEEKAVFHCNKNVVARFFSYLLRLFSSQRAKEGTVESTRKPETLMKKGEVVFYCNEDMATKFYGYLLRLFYSQQAEEGIVKLVQEAKTVQEGVMILKDLVGCLPREPFHYLGLERYGVIKRMMATLDRLGVKYNPPSPEIEEELKKIAA